MDEWILVVDNNGDVHGLWSDIIDVRELGECFVERASSVEFCNDSKKWQVILSDGTFLGEWDSREDAIDNEVSFLQNKLLYGGLI